MGRTAYRIAVIGAGPRALGALEALAERLSVAVEVDLFDPIPDPGAGPNFDPTETSLCLLNIPNRDIDLRPASFEGARVGNFDGDRPDTYPPRAELGDYLEARFRDLLGHRLLGVTHHRRAVTALDARGDGWIVTAGTDHGPYDEVLMTPGQPEVTPDKQLARWQDHATKSQGTLMPAYPARALLEWAADWGGKTVAIRGLGLSTLDVVRVLTLGQGGRFEGGTYRPSGHEPARILPFSLDGHAPAPKPATAEVDAQFTPTEDETERFALSLTASLRDEDPLATLCRALVAPVARITGEGREEIGSWLASERDAPGSQETRSPVAALKAHIAEAEGAAPSIGYATGQLWRKWQDVIRQVYNPATVSPPVAEALVGFDEGLKRYSYGPPVGSARELLGLIKAGIVDLRAADDPDIRLVSRGWELDDGDATLTADIMVDAVLPGPDLATLSGPLFKSLREHGRLVPKVDGLGALTLPDGQCLDRARTVQPGLCLLGRLALGSVIAVDSLHDCFGASTDRWADGVLERLPRLAASPDRRATRDAVDTGG
ncbi:FAD/NAD(P)-binding protein [Maritimibacter sp. DP1N21-5]|uniref:FAD/NAD(P)-binding protein n=1 Tax=Maritimibacter sp. DP1N21-5 TaxID=2836867 RepID=UPI001C48682C|nr:FAD/NAD(P)-binding protein [Maritimibacter sp. DP1N21-5]MBV7410394.1 FAD/NAD(P)-binding protein [Maritimibacter sp. DP1N21-5]